ncbi:MAG: TraR/DksA C4-type zinc finger protein [Gemmatimonadota bacterium]|nr:TraR/DksA C4-type zinc finger protein [Gemmatimonadota bacterium]
MTSPDHLSEDQLAALRAELDRELAKLEQSMEVTDEALRPVQLDQTAVGRLSRIDSLQNQGLTKNLREREQAKLGMLVEALKRIEAGRYGICEECGGPIPFERLIVMPETPTCSACA